MTAAVLCDAVAKVGAQLPAVGAVGAFENLQRAGYRAGVYMGHRPRLTMRMQDGYNYCHSNDSELYIDTSGQWSGTLLAAFHMAF